MKNPLVHFEFMAKDTAKCKAFYSAVFDWEFDDQTMPGYTLIETGQDPSGGLFPKPPEAPHPCLNVYFAVGDIDATLARVNEHGGKTLVDKTSIPNVGDFAMFIDPEQIVVGLLKQVGASLPPTPVPGTAVVKSESSTPPLKQEPGHGDVEQGRAFEFSVRYASKKKKDR